MRWRRQSLVERLAPRCTGLTGDLPAQLVDDCQADTAARETDRLIDFLTLVDLDLELRQSPAP